MVTPARFDVVLVQLDPTVGREIKKTRPCVVVSPDELNRHLDTVIVLPLTSKIKHFPSRIQLTFQGRKGEVAVDQVRTISLQRVVKKIGKISDKSARDICDKLHEMFEY